jgi:glycosyltransferase involved in cell wall biosynthesis
MKFALISQVVPPSWSGQAVLIRRLLDGVEPAAYCLLISDNGYYRDGRTGRLGAKYHHLPRLPRIDWGRGSRWGLAAAELLNAAIGIGLRTLQIRRLVRAEGCAAIVAFTGDFHDAPAGYLTSRSLKLPFYLYVCDYYSLREVFDPARRRLAPCLERRILRGAAGVICGNETLGNALRARYAIEPVVIHHPSDLTRYRTAPRPQALPPSRGLRIVYTGTIYNHAHLDAVQNLLVAIDRLDGPSAALHVYSGQSEDELDGLGLHGRVIVHPHEPPEAIAAVQAAADVLFLPLAFRSLYPEVIRTSSPMKFGDYLAAGGPILVHAPPGSFISEYCRRHDCGIVVDEPDPARLGRALEELAADESLRARLIGNARERAAKDFSPELARERFAALIGLDDGHQGR